MSYNNPCLSERLSAAMAQLEFLQASLTATISNKTETFYIRGQERKLPSPDKLAVLESDCGFVIRAILRELNTVFYHLPQEILDMDAPHAGASNVPGLDALEERHAH